MKTVLIANVISFIGCLLMVAIGLIKERRKILLTQCVLWAILTVSNLMLGGNFHLLHGCERCGHAEVRDHFRTDALGHL